MESYLSLPQSVRKIYLLFLKKVESGATILQPSQLVNSHTTSIPTHPQVDQAQMMDLLLQMKDNFTAASAASVGGGGGVGMSREKGKAGIITVVISGPSRSGERSTGNCVDAIIAGGK